MSERETQEELDRWEQAKRDAVLMKKVKQGIIKGQVIPTEEELVPKTPREKLANFWYHYKWAVLGTALGLFIFGFLIVDLVTKEKSDITVQIATVQGASVLRNDLEALFAPYTSDIDGDGKQQVQAAALDLMEDPQQDARRYNTLEVQLTVTLTSQTPAIYLLDDATYRRLTYYEMAGQEPQTVERFVYLEELFPDNPYVRGDRYYLAGSPLEEKIGWSELPEDFALVIKKPYDNPDRDEAAEYQEALAAFTRLIQDSPLDTPQSAEALQRLEEIANERVALPTE